MTDDQMQSVRDDIAYMRGLAHEGRKTPLLGGSILIAAGLIFGTASVGHWAIISGVVGLSVSALTPMWLVATLGFFVALTVLRVRIGRKPGAFSPVNKATGAAWMGVGIGIFVMAIAMAVVAAKVQSVIPILLFPSLIFALYGAGWAVSAAMSDKKWLWWLAIGAWIAAPAIALLTGEPEQYLAYAAGLLLLTTVPGLIMVRQEPAEVI
jgi:hypothetical protein